MSAESKKLREMAAKARQEYTDQVSAVETTIAFYTQALRQNMDAQAVFDAKRYLPKLYEKQNDLAFMKSYNEKMWEHWENQAAAIEHGERVQAGQAAIENEAARIDALLNNALGVSTLPKAERARAVQKLLDGEGSKRLDGSSFIVATGAHGLSERVTLAADGSSVSFSSE